MSPIGLAALRENQAGYPAHIREHIVNLFTNSSLEEIMRVYPMRNIYMRYSYIRPNSDVVHEVSLIPDKVVPINYDYLEIDRDNLLRLALRDMIERAELRIARNAIPLYWDSFMVGEISKAGAVISRYGQDSKGLFAFVSNSALDIIVRHPFFIPSNPSADLSKNIGCVGHLRDIKIFLDPIFPSNLVLVGNNSIHNPSYVFFPRRINARNKLEYTNLMISPESFATIQFNSMV